MSTSAQPKVTAPSTRPAAGAQAGAPAVENAATIAKYVVKKMPTNRPAMMARCRYLLVSSPVIVFLLSSASSTVLTKVRPGNSGSTGRVEGVVGDGGCTFMIPVWHAAAASTLRTGVSYLAAAGVGVAWALTGTGQKPLI